MVGAEIGDRVLGELLGTDEVLGASLGTNEVDGILEVDGIQEGLA